MYRYVYSCVAKTRHCLLCQDTFFLCQDMPLSFVPKKARLSAHHIINFVQYHIPTSTPGGLRQAARVPPAAQAPPAAPVAQTVPVALADADADGGLGFGFSYLEFGLTYLEYNLVYVYIYIYIYYIYIYVFTNLHMIHL